MITKMTKYSFILLSQDKEQFIDKLSSFGVVDITRSCKAIDETSAAMIAKADSLKKCITLLEEYASAQVSGENLDADTILSRSNELAEKLTSLKNQEVLISKEIELRSHWGEADFDKISALKAQGCYFHFYICDEKKFEKTDLSVFACEVISKDKGKVCFTVISSSEDSPIESLKEISLEGDIRQSMAEDEKLKAEISQTKQALEVLAAQLPTVRSAYESLMRRFDRYLAEKTEQSAADGLLSVYVGFAPEAEKQRLEEAFETLEGVYCIGEDACVQDNPPIKLRNNRFVSMFEVLTDMYGRPAYNGFDPTPYISIFFLLFFAMCMGDAGYGVVLIILGFLLKKVKSFASLAPLVSVLGCATVVVGLFFHTFFSVDLLGLEWIPDGVKACMLPSKIAGYDATMIVAIAVGIVHLCLAMIVKTVYATKNEGFRRSVSVWGWTVFIVGTVVALMVALAGVIDTQICKWIIIGLGIVSAIGIFPLRTPGKNPLINVGAGLWETYNTATGILGDVLSYLRLYALGLAGSMLGYAFNDLALMTLGDGGIGGWIPFVLIVIIGHTLNLAMAALGAFVHPLRLNFLEFFKNSGYEALGSKYNPLTKE